MKTYNEPFLFFVESKADETRRMVMEIIPSFISSLFVEMIETFAPRPSKSMILWLGNIQIGVTSCTPTTTRKTWKLFLYISCRLSIHK